MSDQYMRDRWEQIDSKWIPQDMYRCTFETPWDVAQTVEKLAPGILSITTAGHGGIFLSIEKIVKLPPAMREFRTWAGEQFYEEDMDAMIPYIAFIDEIGDFYKKRAGEYVEVFQRPAFTNYFGWPVCREFVAILEKYVNE